MEAAIQRPQRQTEYHFGRHPTASRAVLLMGIAGSMTAQTTSSFILPMHPAVNMLSYCVDTTVVCVVNICHDETDMPCNTRKPLLLVTNNISSSSFFGLQSCTIEDGFLSHSTLLRDIDVSGLTAIVKIRDHFFEQCVSVSSIDLSGLRNVTYVGESFLA
eukprot:PhM_4_TR12666/c0_g2_i1/m.74450